MASERAKGVDNHTRLIVRAAIGKGLLGAARGSAAATVAEAHDEVARALQRVALDHGSDAMAIAAEYALAAMEEGALYTTSDAVEFVRLTAGEIRSTMRSIAKGGALR